MRTALILVDIQNDFCPGGALAVPDGDQVVAVANAIMGDYNVVVASQDWHPIHHESFASMHGKNPYDVIELDSRQQVLWPDHCVQGSIGARLHEGLDHSRIHRVFRKGTDARVDSYSAFFDDAKLRSTGLSLFLQDERVTSVSIMGLALDYCVKATALDARAIGFDTMIIENGCRAVNLKPGDGEAALKEMSRFGVGLVQA
jgi:nicotinamidase/pyrazinamidase